jgi:hypothetical protein
MKPTTEQRDLLRKISAKTSERKLKWQEDAEPNSYSVLLPGGTKVKTRIDADRTRYVLIYAEDGRQLFEFDEERDERAGAVYSVANAAENSALGLDDAIDDISSELDTL